MRRVMGMALGMLAMTLLSMIKGVHLMEIRRSRIPWVT